MKNVHRSRLVSGTRYPALIALLAIGFGGIALCADTQEAARFAGVIYAQEVAGAFSQPSGLEYDAETDRLFVADLGNDRIVICEPADDGYVVTGTYDADGKMEAPSDLALAANGSFLVIERKRRRLAVYNPSGGLTDIFSFLGCSNAKSVFPDRVAVDEQGNIFVTDRENARLLSYTSEGDFRFEVGAPPAERTYGFAGIGPDGAGGVYAVDPLFGLVYHYSGAGALVSTIGDRGSESGEYGFLYDVALFEGNLLALDRHKGVITLISADGKISGSAASKGAMSGRLRYPHSVVTGKDRIVFISDELNSRISLFRLTESTEGEGSGDESQSE